MDTVFTQQVDHRLLDATDEIADAQTAPVQVDEQINNGLTGTVIGNLAAAIDANHFDAVIKQPVFRLARTPQGIDRRMLAKPEFIGGLRHTGGGEVDHRLPGIPVFDAPQPTHPGGQAVQRIGRSGRRHGGAPAETTFAYRTTLISGWPDSSRYSASSCAFDVALIVQVKLR